MPIAVYITSVISTLAVIAIRSEKSKVPAAVPVVLSGLTPALVAMFF